MSVIWRTSEPRTGCLSGSHACRASPIAFHRGRHQPRHRRAAVEDLDLAAATDFAKMAGQVRLQFGHRRGTHRDQYGLRIQVMQVIYRASSPGRAPYPAELADVVRHEHEAERQRVRRNQHVVGADRPAAPFEVRAHLGAGHGRGAVERPTGDLLGQGIEPASVGGTGAGPEGMARRPRSACAAPYGRVCSSCQRGWWWRAQRSVTVPSIMARAVPGTRRCRGRRGR